MTDQPAGGFSERMGDLLERMGQPRIAGRIFGHLLVCTPPEQSAAQLRSAVDASAGSVSTMLQLLRNAGLVEARGEPGSRRRWYRVSPGAFARVLAVRMRFVTELENLAEMGLREIDRDTDPERLLEMRDCYAFFSREFPALLERYRSTVRNADG